MKKSINITFLTSILFFACSDSVVTVEPRKNETNSLLSNSEVFGKAEQHNHTHASDSSQSNVLHKIKALEVLTTDRYVYVRAEENGTEYWLASNKTKVDVGAMYYFTGGYLQKNFPSKEFNRVFSELLLVNNLVGENHGKESRVKKP